MRITGALNQSTIYTRLERDRLRAEGKQINFSFNFYNFIGVTQYKWAVKANKLSVCVQGQILDHISLSISLAFIPSSTSISNSVWIVDVWLPFFLFLFFYSLFLSLEKSISPKFRDYEVRYRDVKYLKSDENDKALNKLIFKDNLKEL